MLWVRLPPEPVDNNTPSGSSLECSPPCQGVRRCPERGDFVGSTPTLVTDNLIPWSNGDDACVTYPLQNRPNRPTAGPIGPVSRT